MFEYDDDFYVTNLEVNVNESVDFYKKEVLVKII